MMLPQGHQTCSGDPSHGSRRPRSAADPHHHCPQHSPTSTSHSMCLECPGMPSPLGVAPLPSIPVSAPLPPLPASHQALWIWGPSHLPEPSAFLRAHGQGPATTSSPGLSWGERPGPEKQSLGWAGSGSQERVCSAQGLEGLDLLSDLGFGALCPLVTA